VCNNHCVTFSICSYLLTDFRLYYDISTFKNISVHSCLDLSYCCQCLYIFSCHMGWHLTQVDMYNICKTVEWLTGRVVVIGNYIPWHGRVELNTFALQDADKNIIKWLKDHGRLVHQGTVAHSYPFCWRSVYLYSSSYYEFLVIICVLILCNLSNGCAVCYIYISHNFRSSVAVQLIHLHWEHFS